jgi:diguanylate cyclase (GGDEF)-like protein
MRSLRTRNRLMLLLILAVVPALGLTVYSSLAQRVAAESQMRGDIVNLARIGALQQSQIFDGAKQLLIGFSLQPAELRNDSTRCNEYVRQVLQKTGRLYFSMGLYGFDGELQCLGTLLDRAAQRAVESGQLSIGEYPRALLARPEGFTLSYPIVDAQRPATEVAFVTLNLAEFGELATKLPLPEAVVLTVIDRNGVVLARNPGGNDIIGRKLDPLQVPENMLVGRNGVFYGSGADGAPQLFAYESVAETSGGPAALRVLVGVPLSVIYADANATLIRTLTGVLLATFLLLIGAWYGAESFFLRNVRTLLDTANRIRAGDLSARTGMPYGNEELSQIGKAFDEMAETLQERKKRIDNAIVSLHQRSISDTLTGLHNRRFLYETLPREIVRAKRNGTTIGVIIVDLDHFKRINDTYGHEAGDMALRWVGGVLKESVRGSDVVCRHGGEEFCVVLPEASGAGAQTKAEEIRAALEALKLDYSGQPLKITASFGVAIYPEHGMDADTLLRLADEALYNAKSAGRNRVVVYSKDAAIREIRKTTTASERGAAAQAVVSMAAVVSDIKSGGTGRRPQGPPPHPVETGGAADRPAALQVLTGAFVGKEFALVNATSTIGKTGSEIAVITRMSQGYFITHVEGPKFPIVNGSTIESRARRLTNRDVIEVAGVKMVFFYK